MPLPVDAERDNTSIVLVGAFNPVIFQPMWLASNDLISREDADTAEINLIVPDIAQFSARQFKLSVERDKFSVTCETIYRGIVRDLVMSCFGGILTHTPIRLMGINRELHFSCSSEVQRSEFGFQLAPLAPWGKWGEAIAKKAEDKDLYHGGMMRVTMREWPRPDGHEGYFQTEIQPSPAFKSAAGVYVATNDHFELKADQKDSAREMMGILEDAWEPGAVKAEGIISDIMLRATGKGA